MAPALSLGGNRAAMEADVALPDQREGWMVMAGLPVPAAGCEPDSDPPSWPAVEDGPGRIGVMGMSPLDVLASSQGSVGLGRLLLYAIGVRSCHSL
ncbi:MAG: hypothetical protein EA402_00655 [Planctomycetota bacterium]|nr:MAG: hypothetical protein EA402_00655 [Planctomycetota bacterium]